MATTAQVTRTIRGLRKSVPLYETRDDYGTDSLFNIVLEKELSRGEESSQSGYIGKLSHPFNMAAATRLVLTDPYHARCLDNKVQSTVGLGFRREPIMKNGEVELDPLTHKPKLKAQSPVAKALNGISFPTFQQIITPVADDYYHTGNGWIEVVRSPDGTEIVGLHHAQACRVFIWKEGGPHFHYEMNSSPGDTQFGPQKFAVFGDLVKARERLKLDETTLRSELIHIPRMTSLDRHYGFPGWLSAVPAIELSQALHQHNYDFFLNRGVPEFMLFILGREVDPETWEAIEESMQAHIGLSKSHKSMAINLTDPEVRVQLEKLAMEVKGDAMFKDFTETLALEIVSAHGVPPLLAGIQIPGKLGATNEMVQAIAAFQALVIGPAQRTFEEILACTLGSEIGEEDNYVLRTITEEIDLGNMDTVSRMRESVPEARAEGRDMNAGVQKSATEVSLVKAFNKLSSEEQEGLVKGLMGRVANG